MKKKTTPSSCEILSLLCLENFVVLVNKYVFTSSAKHAKAINYFIFFNLSNAHIGHIWP